MKIALLGNPNTGKSSIFNMLTGLRQHVGNFPGITVDKKYGTVTLNGDRKAELIDFPGNYSLYPRSTDEEVVYQVLTNPTHIDYPDIALVVIDASNLERNLYFFSQIYDLGIPCVLAVNMLDLAKKQGKEIDVIRLGSYFPGAKVVQVTARDGMGKGQLISALGSILMVAQDHTFLPNAHICAIDDLACQEQEATERYKKIELLVPQVQKINQLKKKSFTRLDQLLTHKVWGYVIFVAILLIIFQFIFSFAELPMNWIDGGFSDLAVFLETHLPTGILTNLLVKGVLPGISGVLVFIPQIALLFFFIAILEESGYLARVVFILDRLMRPLGLNGKSAVPLLSSAACAVPGIMAARTIANPKERLITILVAPLISCSARIPVYTLLIALVIPAKNIAGIFNLQGVVLLALYALGIIAALIVAFILKWLIPLQEKGFLMLELPTYRAPIWKNVGLIVIEKVKIFIVNAGQMIFAISILLWAAASFGPGNRMAEAEQKIHTEAKEQHYSTEQTNELVASAKLENSYIGHFGKWIEPSIRPLGYDWKIGIALLSSFAAREVFVGTLSTIYSIHDESGDQHRLLDRMKKEKKRDGTPVFTLASGVSLMIFYAFAMQCMSTLSVVKTETNSWKWPIIQFLYMSVMAYLGALFTFYLLS